MVADLRHVVFSLLRPKMQKYEETTKLNSIVTDNYYWFTRMKLNRYVNLALSQNIHNNIINEG
jgi:hypothetical protein